MSAFCEKTNLFICILQISVHGDTQFKKHAMSYRIFFLTCLFSSLYAGELYTVACSPTDATLVATGGGDDKGFLWRIGHGDWAVELQGTCM